MQADDALWPRILSRVYTHSTVRAGGHQGAEPEIKNAKVQQQERFEVICKVKYDLPMFGPRQYGLQAYTAGEDMTSS